MTYKQQLLGTSLFSILLLSFHFTQDALHARPGTFEAGTFNFIVILMLSIVLAGTVLLRERRSGQLLMLVVAVGAMAVPVLHFRLTGDMNKYAGAFFFVWSMIALGVAGLFSVLLLTLELPRVWRGPDPDTR